MKKSWIIIATVIAIIVGFLMWWFSDTQVLKRRTQELTELFSFEADGSKVTRINKNRLLGEILDKDFSCIIQLESYRGEHHAGELVEGHIYLGQVCETSSVDMADFEITSIDDNEATIVAHFSIYLAMKKGGRNYAEESPVTLTWEKSPEGLWLLNGAKLESETAP